MPRNARNVACRGDFGDLRRSSSSGSGENQQPEAPSRHLSRLKRGFLDGEELFSSAREVAAATTWRERAVPAAQD